MAQLFALLKWIGSARMFGASSLVLFLIFFKFDSLDALKLATLLLLLSVISHKIDAARPTK